MRYSLYAAALIGCVLFSCSGSRKRNGENELKFSASFKALEYPDSNRVNKLEPAFAGAEKIYKEYAVKNHIPAIAYGIVLDGKLIYSGANGTINLKNQQQATTQSLFRIASMTKSFTALAIMKLHEQGKLNIMDPGSKYVPEMKAFVYLTHDTSPITIQNLLTMTAGFPEDNPWGDRQLEDTDYEFLTFLRGGVSFSSPPGYQYEYSNLGYAILGNIVTRVSGMPYQQYITKEILHPLGMDNTFWEYSEVPEDKLAIGYRWEDEQWKEEPMLHDGALVQWVD